MKKLNKELINQLKEQAQLELARRNFYDFCIYMYPDFFTPGKPHLKEVAEDYQEAFEAYLRGEKRKIIIAMPPRWAKSFEVSLFCAWALGKNPTGSIMRNTYSASLSESFSYYIRELIQSEKYLKVFPEIKLKEDKQKIDEWQLEGTPRPSYFCAGVGGSITGKGASMLAILDDPIKNMEDGMSPTILKKTWEWYNSTHQTRLEGNCIEIIVATRWNTADPTGRVIEADEKENEWIKKIIPALIDGESSCPEIKSTKELLKLKKIMDSFIWDALYQQQPANVEGVLFKKSDLNWFESVELQRLIDSKQVEVIVGYVDVADTGSDSLCSIMGYKVGEKIYVADVIFTQDPIEITEPLVAAQIIQHQPSLATIESNNGGRSFAINIQRLIKGKSRTFINPLHNTANKETRILLKSGQIKQFFVFMSDYKEGSQYDAFIRELTAYVKLGKNKHDDSVDAITGLAETIFDNERTQIRVRSSNR